MIIRAILSSIKGTELRNLSYILNSWPGNLHFDLFDKKIIKQPKMAASFLKLNIKHFLDMKQLFVQTYLKIQSVFCASKANAP